MAEAIVTVTAPAPTLTLSADSITVPYNGSDTGKIYVTSSNVTNITNPLVEKHQEHLI